MLLHLPVFLQLNGGTGQIAAGQPIQLYHSVCTGKPSLTYCSCADRQFGNDGGDGGDDGGNIDFVWPAVAAAPTCAPCCSPNCTARSAAGAPASHSVALGRTLQRQLVTHDAHCCFFAPGQDSARRVAMMLFMRAFFSRRQPQQLQLLPAGSAFSRYWCRLEKHELPQLPMLVFMSDLACLDYQLVLNKSVWC